METDRVKTILRRNRVVSELSRREKSEATAEARFAASLDRLQPLLCNYYTQGGAWKEYGVDTARVFARNAKIDRGTKELWSYARHLLDDALAQGYLLPVPAQAGSESTS